MISDGEVFKTSQSNLKGILLEILHLVDCSVCYIKLATLKSKPFDVSISVIKVVLKRAIFKQW